MKQESNRQDRLRRDLARAYQRIVEKEEAAVRGDHAVRLPQTARQFPRMELVGQVAGELAQYFNNILALIIGYGSLLQSRLEERDPLKTYVHQILASSERAALLTRSLLAYSRKQVLNPKPVSINAMIRQAGRLMQRVIGEGIEFNTKLADVELPVCGDAVQLEQAMMNLVTNARDAMPHGGALTVETKLVEMDNIVIGTGKRSAKCAMISFSDTGMGMDRATKERIFEPFYTTKEPGKGTGLGLAIVHGIIKQHNGSINVTSEEGRGTRFSIYLPILHNVREEVRVPMAVAKGSGYYS